MLKNGERELKSIIFIFKRRLYLNLIFKQIACKAMCKMLISVESGYELEALQKEVGNVCEAMLAFPLRLPGTRFYKGLQVKLSIQMTPKMIKWAFSIRSLH